MKDILSSRGLAALGWLSAFGYLWAFALGWVPGGWQAVGMVTFSLLVALAAGAGAQANERKEMQERVAADLMRVTHDLKANPPAWTNPGSPGGGGKR